MLYRCVDTSTVAATLALAEEYNCHGLKQACIQFLMSGSNLKAAMAAGGFEHFRSSCPSVLKELLGMVNRR
jgi:speckle-type POZ protein